jgi:hypothetical protein
LVFLVLRAIQDDRLVSVVTGDRFVAATGSALF